MEDRKPLVLDLDGVIATGTEETVYSNEAGWAYENCTVLDGAKEGLKALHEKYYIILSTARWKCDTEKTVKWLEENGLMLYIDELQVGVKRSAVAYIDDKGYRFDNWEQTLKDFMVEGEEVWNLTPRNLT